MKERVKKFLQNREVRKLSYDTKLKFLMGKGLKEEEIQEMMNTQVVVYSGLKYIMWMIGIGGGIVSVVIIIEKYIIPWWNRRKIQRTHKEKITIKLTQEISTTPSPSNNEEEKPQKEE
ncbi:hypothetical protein EDI_269520 [Entamoeba dispar SAW760]|uniref:Peroxisome membrane anchor protein Pex14p N-terminal domain-containing protein n=1 Tax=Entamoeba dispar (strain ATCC PRA-260 / SAW760) TaxID=370354 RepID=B0ERP1_ENTDS|nr:uncharacterized protein EDI_269520 [Entamoeba dispar SAW760]EDR22804.1 hypothetical protein EDI_269520 [Entamoeba dispar SAW760]|eukprot:EDR22804.1 hypothetical protein EDI_269520 [Entamoeba dispar SAW760]